MTKGLLFRVFFRSFFIQASWNFERMQNLGFCYSILPVLKSLHSSDDLKKAIKRHLEFFNTQPYMTAPILGVVSWMEESLHKGHLLQHDVSAVKTGVMGSYGAIGDSFFWGALRPFSSVLAVCLVIASYTFAPAVFLIIFNVPHLLVRAYGFWSGAIHGIEVFDVVGRVGLADLARHVKVLALVLAGIALALLSGKTGDFFALPSYLWSSFFTVAIFLLFVEMMKRGFSPQTIFYLIVVFSVIVATFV